MDSFSSHRSSSFLLAHSRQLLGSFSKSFSRGVSRGLRRSASFVQLVWTYPTGWQPQRGAGRGPGRGQGRTLPGETSGGWGKVRGMVGRDAGRGGVGVRVWLSAGGCTCMDVPLAMALCECPAAASTCYKVTLYLYKKPVSIM
jgi:hypothetical protein